jgi:predicted choloylglycine hydrolase
VLLRLQALREGRPGPVWKATFERLWPGYRRWFLSEGPLARAGYVTSSMQLERHMPELMPTYETLTELAGGGDLAARFLSLYAPPPYLAGCSQAVWGDGERLIRNYDYTPAAFDGVLLASDWVRPVIAMLDSTWGALDGINDAGLVASLAFGGRKVTGDGFGIPLLVRYVLETCATTSEAVRALARLPSHMAYSVTLLDAERRHATVHLAPDRKAEVTTARVCTNHQRRVEWPDYAALTRSVEREAFLRASVLPLGDVDDAVEAFLRPPLHATSYRRGFGTLYTAAYAPATRSVLLRWPRGQAFEAAHGAFTPRLLTLDLRASATVSLVQ